MWILKQNFIVRYLENTLFCPHSSNGTNFEHSHKSTCSLIFLNAVSLVDTPPSVARGVWNTPMG